MKFGGPDLVVLWGAIDVTQHVQGDIEIPIEVMFSDSKPFGQSVNESMPTGDVTIGDFGWNGLYDEGDNAPKRLWDPLVAGVPTTASSPVTLTVKMGTTGGSPVDSYAIPVFVKSFKPKGSRNKVHEYSVMFTKGHGAVTRT